MSKFAKSLSELDVLADEILSKAIDDKEELKPEEISENVPDDASEEVPEEDNTPAEDDKEKDEDEEIKKGLESGVDDEDESDEEDLEKCGTSKVKKSDDVEPVEEDKDGDEDDESLKKGEDSDDLDSDDNGEDDEDISKDSIEKSIKRDFTSNRHIEKSMDASEFLTSVVEILSKSLADASGEIQISRSDNERNTVVLAKSLKATLSMNKSMAKDLTRLKKENAALKKSIQNEFSELKATLNEVLSQPAGMRKSVSNIHVMDRNFQSSLNGSSVSKGIESLSKSQIMDILVSEMHAGNSAVTASDVVAFESGAPLHAGLISLVNSKCK